MLIFLIAPQIIKIFIKDKFLFGEQFEDHHPRINEWAFQKCVVSNGHID